MDLDTNYYNEDEAGLIDFRENKQTFKCHPLFIMCSKLQMLLFKANYLTLLAGIAPFEKAAVKLFAQKYNNK